MGGGVDPQQPQMDRRELLVFVTPRILKDNLTVR